MHNLPFELCDDDCGIRWMGEPYRVFDQNFRGALNPETNMYPWPKQTAQRKARLHYNALCAAFYDGRASGLAIRRDAAE